MAFEGSPQESTRQVHGAIARGAAWLTAMKLTERALGLINTVVLARLLAPQDFGLVAMAMVVVTALDALTSFGLDSVLIQRQNATKAHYDTAFTINVIVGASVALILIVSSGAVAAFYSDTRLQPIMYVLAMNFFARSLENIRVIDFRKHFKYHLEATLRLSVKLVGLAVTIPAAIELHSYWALIIGMATMTVFNVALSYAMRPYRPTLTLAAARDIMSFSGWLLLNSTVFLMKAQIHNIFIGRLLGPKALGTFNMANEIAMMSSSELIAPINRAVYPGYAKLNSELPALRATFLDVFALIMILSVPAGLGTIAIAQDLATLLLGNAWLETIPLIKFIAICGVLQTLNSNMMYVVIALGQPQLATRIAFAEAFSIVPLMYLATRHFGLIGAGASLVACYCFVSVPMWWRTTTKLLDLRLIELLGRIARPLVAAIVMYVTVSWLQMTVLHDAPRPIAIAIAVVSGIVVYAMILGTLWHISGQPRGGESIVRDFIGRRFAQAIE
jgi:O-antigen/teichoic acid export membrane protein